MRIITSVTACAARAARAACVAGLVVLPLLQGCSGTPSGAPTPAPGGSQGRSSQTGATASVSGKVADQQPAADIGAMLAGRVPGLQVVRSTNGDISLRIRGNTPLTDPVTGQALGETEPLLVIDGMPVSSGGISAALRTLDPHEVANIQVLKDVSSTSGYGIRGANGVILITTNKRKP
jgi:TonB-dependent SusC/RagA subfamily outer membrane receptor